MEKVEKRSGNTRRRYFVRHAAVALGAIAAGVWGGSLFGAHFKHESAKAGAFAARTELANLVPCRDYIASLPGAFDHTRTIRLDSVSPAVRKACELPAVNDIKTEYDSAEHIGWSLPDGAKATDVKYSFKIVMPSPQGYDRRIAEQHREIANQDHPDDMLEGEILMGMAGGLLVGMVGGFGSMAFYPPGSRQEDTSIPVAVG